MTFRKRQPVTTTLGEALSSAFGEVATLQEEMESWRDNMEERLSHTEKYEQVSECADTLGEIADDPDVPDGIDELEVTFTPTCGKRPSRRDRLGEAEAIMQACLDRLEEHRDDAPAGYQPVEGAEDLISLLEDRIGRCADVDFPGMYG